MKKLLALLLLSISMSSFAGQDGNGRFKKVDKRLCQVLDVLAENEDIFISMSTKGGLRVYDKQDLKQRCEDIRREEKRNEQDVREKEDLSAGG